MVTSTNTRLLSLPTWVMEPTRHVQGTISYSLGHTWKTGKTTCSGEMGVGGTL